MLHQLIFGSNKPRFETAQGLDLVRTLLTLVRRSDAKLDPVLRLRPIGTMLDLTESASSDRDIQVFIQQEILPFAAANLKSDSELGVYAGYLLGSLCRYVPEHAFALLLESACDSQHTTYGSFVGLFDCIAYRHPAQKAKCADAKPCVLKGLYAEQVDDRIAQSAARIAERCMTDDDSELTAALVHSAARGNSQAIAPAARRWASSTHNLNEDRTSPHPVNPNAEKIDLTSRPAVQTQTGSRGGANMYGLPMSKILSEARRQLRCQNIVLLASDTNIPVFKVAGPWATGFSRALADAGFTLVHQGSIIRIYNAQSLKRRARTGLFFGVNPMTSSAAVSCVVHQDPGAGCVKQLANQLGLDVTGVSKLDRSIDLLLVDAPWDEALDVLFESTGHKAVLDGKRLTIE